MPLLWNQSINSQPMLHWYCRISIAICHCIDILFLLQCSTALSSEPCQLRYSYIHACMVSSIDMLYIIISVPKLGQSDSCLKISLARRMNELINQTNKRSLMQPSNTGNE
eukprot:906760_1